MDSFTFLGDRVKRKVKIALPLISRGVKINLNQRQLL